MTERTDRGQDQLTGVCRADAGRGGTRRGAAEDGMAPQQSGNIPVTGVMWLPAVGVKQDESEQDTELRIGKSGDSKQGKLFKTASLTNAFIT